MSPCSHNQTSDPILPLSCTEGAELAGTWSIVSIELDQRIVTARRFKRLRITGEQVSYFGPSIMFVRVKMCLGMCCSLLFNAVGLVMVWTDTLG